MTFGQIRLVKWILGITLVSFVCIVGVQLHNSFNKSKTFVSNLLQVDDGRDAVSRQVEITQLDSQGQEAWRLIAAESTGRTDSGQNFKDVEIHVDVGRDKVPVVITADHCILNENETAHLEGNVIVRDSTSMRLEAEVLDFSRYPDQFWTEENVSFSRNDLVGQAGSMRYVMTHGDIYLDNGVKMTLHRNDEDPVRVRSASAIIRRKESRIQFVDDVSVRQNKRSLNCNDLQLKIGENDKIEHIDAFENVEMVLHHAEQRKDIPAEHQSIQSSTQALTEGSASSLTNTVSTIMGDNQGVKHLVSDQADFAFRAGTDELERVRATGKALLTFEPVQRSGERFRRSFAGHRLIFEFDQQGRIASVFGRGGVTLILTPMQAISNKTEKRVSARRLESRFGNETGELLFAKMFPGAHFEQDDFEGTADMAIVDFQSQKVTLLQEPRLWDSQTSMEANTIVIDMASGDTRGSGDVRTTAIQNGTAHTIFPGDDGSGEEPVYFVADQLHYTDETKVTTYQGSAKGFQGDNHIEAERIRIDKVGGVLEARGNVRTLFVAAVADQEEERSTTFTKSGRFDFRRDDGVLHYRRAVLMKNDTMTLSGSRLDVTLGEEHQEIVELLAEGNVEIQASAAEAHGSVARYLPEEQRMTIKGENATLQDGEKITEGKELTFFLSNEKVLVDGQERTRTKTTYSSKRHQL